ncbi:alpha-amylase family glycosyl hydrolase [Nigerium massiliense]|uniref:alpha-amylase family glycosyl hydrolase n=1 Tax=Nigerium massiliense TaxID=1522317 RepID=UPI000591707F|nr:alpha-amylase family glycosyl hydrolase [Nigerium massiliense]
MTVRPRAEAPETWGDAAWPLGAHPDVETGMTTFAVTAPDATRVVLELYATATGTDAVAEFEMVRGWDDIWNAQVAGVGPGTLYAFRCWGPNWPYDERWKRGDSKAGFRSDRDEHGNHFNPNKVLFDPYAREITHTPLSRSVVEAGSDSAVFGSGPMRFGTRPSREIDSGRYAPKGVVVDDDTPTGRRPDAAGNTAIYEAHVKNLTMHPSSARLREILSGVPGFEEVEWVPDELRGTYAGAARMAPYLNALGFTSIELMPVHETDSDHMGAQSGTTNHWGYQTLAFFAPNRDYSSDKTPGGPTREFKRMVHAFHEHGIEVLLDVVYNHTAEGGNWFGDVDATGFTTLGGFGTAEYYVLTEAGGLVDGATGTSNQINFSSTASARLVLDSLKYWNETMGVDGFRFDLAPVLGRRPDDAQRNDWDKQKRFFKDHPVLTSVRNLAIMNDFEVIAEPWDLWGYEVGNFPAGWAEWNGHFRDASRRFLKGDANTHDFIRQFNGGFLEYADSHGPQKSINFIDAHDGFTMFDLVSFNEKQNYQMPPFGPSDGGESENLSWDSGMDQALRRTRWRNNWLTVCLARGIPMVVSGDEYGRTQNGNNNPWNLNTIGMWNNWAQAASNAPTRLPVDPRQHAGGSTYYDVVGQTAARPGINPLLTFASYVARLRRDDPGLRHQAWGGVLGVNARPYRFLRPDLSEVPLQGDRALAVLIDGDETARSNDYAILFNMWDRSITFEVPPLTRPGRPHLKWRRIIDTGSWAEAEGNCWPADTAPEIRTHYEVQPWSIAVLMANAF